MIYKKTTSFLHISNYFFFCVALLLCIGFTTDQSYGQTIPTVKVEKKKKKADIPKLNKKPRQVKDNYQRPKSKRKAEKSKDQYNRPPSKRVRYNNTPGDSRHFSPNAEEGQPVERVSIWQRIFNRNKPTNYGGKSRLNPSGQADGTEYNGKLKRRKVNHKQLSQERHQFRGRIRQAPHKQIDKQFGYKAQHMSSYQGAGKVLKPAREDKRLKGLSTDMQQTGLYKVRKEKDQAAAYTTFRGNLKLPTLKARTHYFKKLSAKVHQYDGDIRYRKPGKDMHPSVFYLKSKTRNSYEQKEKYRRWRLIFMHIFDNKEQPKHLKEKNRKPRYDKNESEIWYY